jgi:hypothetical protein
MLGENKNQFSLTCATLNIVERTKNQPFSSFCRLAAAFLVVASISGYAGTLIDFETLPGGAPANGLVISNQFQQAYGVTFRTIGTETVSLVQTGSAASVFGFCLGPPAGVQDCTTANHLYQEDPLVDAVGSFFISLGDGNVALGYGLIVDLDAPVSQAGGVILDVDASDQWTVRTYSDTNGLTQTSQAIFSAGDPGTGDGRSTLWFFNHQTADIREIRFIYTGPSLAVGEGFDLFNFGQLPIDVPVLSIDSSRQLFLSGRIGRTYLVESTDSLPASNWLTVTNLTLPSSPFPIVDATSTNVLARFYRAIGTP